MKLKNDNNFDGIFEKKFSKRDLYTILQNMNQALYIIALNDKMEIDRFVEVNQAAHDQLGYSREEFLNLSPFEIIDLNDYHFLNEELQQHRGGGPVTIESTHFTKKGEKIPVEVSSRIITLGDNTKYILSTVRNIATSKETELLLERTLKQFESLFNKNPDIIFFLNVEGKFTKVNAASEKILAYSMDELLSMSY